MTSLIERAAEHLASPYDAVDIEVDSNALLYLVQDIEIGAAHSPATVRALALGTLKEASDRLCALVGRLEESR